MGMDWGDDDARVCDNMGVSVCVVVDPDASCNINVRNRSDLSNT